MKSCYVYFFYDSEYNLLYIGKTTTLSQRLQQHFSKDSLKYDPWKSMVDKQKITVYECKNPTDLDIYETYFINKYQPIFNRDKVFNYSPSFELPELEPCVLLEATNEKIHIFNNLMNKKQKKALREIFKVNIEGQFTKYNPITDLLEFKGF